MTHSNAGMHGSRPHGPARCIAVCLLTRQEGEGRARLGVAAAQRAHEDQAPRGLRDVDEAAAANAQHGAHAAHVDVAALIHLHWQTAGVLGLYTAQNRFPA